MFLPFNYYYFLYSSIKLLAETAGNHHNFTACFFDAHLRMIASGSVLRIVTTLCKRPLYRIMCSPYLLQKLHLPYLRYLLITHLPHNVPFITESCVIKMCLSTNCCCLLSLFSQACSLPMFMFIGRRA